MVEADSEAVGQVREVGDWVVVEEVAMVAVGLVVVNVEEDLVVVEWGVGGLEVREVAVVVVVAVVAVVMEVVMEGKG